MEEGIEENVCGGRRPVKGGRMSCYGRGCILDDGECRVMEEVVFWITERRLNRTAGPLSPYRFEACTHYQARSSSLTL